MLLCNVPREAEWCSGYHGWQSSHRSLVRPRLVAVLPPTGPARLGTGTPSAFDSCHHSLTGTYRTQVFDRIGEEQKKEPGHLQQRAPPPPPPDGRLPPHPLLAFARAAARAARAAGIEPGASGAGVQGASTEARGAATVQGCVRDWRRDAQPYPTFPHRASLGRHP